jgi:coatomer subunit delta
VLVEEKISATINRDGGLQSMELNGTMMLKINDPSSTKVKLSLAHSCDSSVVFKTHPNVDKALWSNSSTIALRDPSRPYPVSQPLGILRWNHKSTQESSLPISGIQT